MGQWLEKIRQRSQGKRGESAETTNALDTPSSEDDMEEPMDEDDDSFDE